MLLHEETCNVSHGTALYAKAIHPQLDADVHTVLSAWQLTLWYAG